MSVRYPDLSLVLATYNSAEALSRTLPRNLDAGFGEIVVIDGFSRDHTLEVVGELEKSHPGRIAVYQLPKKGLANARNEGSRRCTGRYIMHAGPDNAFEPEAVDTMLDSLEHHDLVSCQTFLEESGRYWDTVHNYYKRRFAAGPQSVVGTPYVARRELFEVFPFDETMLNSDDTELCQRLSDAGKTIYRTRAVCTESGFHTLDDFWERWPRWGRGDSLFYGKMKSGWSWRRRGKSWLHPLHAELIQPSAHMKPWQYVYSLPFLLMVCSFRYYGWIRHAVSGK